MRNFSYSNYRRMLKEFKKDYEFTSFSTVKLSKKKARKKIILRHDIDLDLKKALEMAEVEAEIGVTATYFIFLRCPFYNPVAIEEAKIIRRLISLDHNIGLHFDFNRYGKLEKKNIVDEILREIKFMESFYEVKMDAVSFHRPISLNYFQKLKIDSYPHTYETFFTSEFNYLSDSRAIWRYGHPLESQAFKNKQNLHILVHPIWWNEKNLSGLESIKKFKRRKSYRLNRNLQIDLKAFWETLNGKD